MTTHQDPAIPALPALSQGLIDLISRYGLARTDQVSEIDRIHLWETLIAGIKDYAGARWLDGYAAGRAAGVQGEARAWMHPDGRVVPASTMATAKRDGGASASSLAGYNIPLYTAPQAEGAVASVSSSNDMEGFVQWADRRLPVGTLLYTAPQAETLAVADSTIRAAFSRVNDKYGHQHHWNATSPGVIAFAREVLSLAAPTPTASIAPKGDDFSGVKPPMRHIAGVSVDVLRRAALAALKAEGEAAFGWFKLHEDNDQWGAYQVSAAYANDPKAFKLYAAPVAQAAAGASEALVLMVDYAIQHGWPYDAQKRIEGIREADKLRATPRPEATAVAPVVGDVGLDNSRCKFANGGARCVSHCGDAVCIATA